MKAFDFFKNFFNSEYPSESPVKKTYKKRGRPKKYFTDIKKEFHPELMYLINKKTNNYEYAVIL